MRQTAVSFNQPSTAYTTSVEGTPQQIKDIRLKRTSLLSRFLAIPLAILVLPALMLAPFGPSK